MISKPRRPATFFVFVALIVAFAAVVVFAFTIQQQRIDNLNHVIEGKNQIIANKEAQLAQLLDNYAALADDCFEAEDCTTTTPPASVIERTLPGVQGDPGPAGPGASDSQVADQVRAYCGAREDCRGPKGADGTNGANGVNGADSTTAGPQGETGPAGATGADGQPPYSWTYIDMLGFTHNCTRTDPFDTASPTYICD